MQIVDLHNRDTKLYKRELKKFASSHHQSRDAQIAGSDVTDCATSFVDPQRLRIQIWSTIFSPLFLSMNIFFFLASNFILKKWEQKDLFLTSRFKPATFDIAIF